MSDPRPLLAGVIGWPVGHSRSPRLFDHWFARLGIAARYVPLRVATGDFAQVYRALPRAGFRGVNITVPHKITALALADVATPAAQAIGAANMIIFDPDQGIIADNTDAYGFAENLRAAAPGWQTTAPALVLGAGGAARAVLHALLAAGVSRIRLANRSPAAAEALAQVFGPRVQPWPWAERAAAVADAGLVVNTTSLGMTGAPPLDLALDTAGNDTLVTDIVYTPLETPLLAQARARGLATVDGLGMLLHQARPACAAWFGVDPPVDAALRAACLAP